MTLGSGVRHIELYDRGDDTDKGFDSCSSLTNITVTGLNSCCSSLNGVLFDKTRQSLTLYDAFRGLNRPSLAGLYFKGSVPGFDGWISGAERATVYYLPGTAGWKDTFGGLPTALWEPQIQSGDGSFGVRANQFGFNVTWAMASGMTVAVEACTNLVNPVWAAVETHTFSSDTFSFCDPEWKQHPARFYRLRVQ